jgi:hypothetical protein
MAVLEVTGGSKYAIDVGAGQDLDHNRGSGVDAKGPDIRGETEQLV